MAVELETETAEPPPRPRAPRARVSRFTIPARIFSKSALVTLVDVKDSFSSATHCNRGAGCRTPVNDRSRRRRLGKRMRAVVTDASVTYVCRNFRDCRLGSWNVSVPEVVSSFQILATLASVYYVIGKHNLAAQLRICRPTQSAIPATFNTSRSEQLRRIGATDIGGTAV